MELLEEMEYIGDVPKGWKWVKLGDAPLNIIDGDRGKNYPSNNELKNNGYCLFLSTKNVKSDGFCFDECQFITKEKDEALKKGKLKRFDLVFTTRGTIGNVGYFNSKVKYENIRINSGMVIIRPDTRSLNPEFNYYIFKFIGKYINSFVSGSAQPQLPIRDLKEVKIPLPPLPEQKAIAGVLSSLDDKIELLHRQNKTLEEMAMTLFRQWFIDANFDGTIGQIVNVQGGYAFKSKDFKPDGNHSVIKIKNITNSIININDTEFIEESVVKNLEKKFKIFSGDVLIAMTGAEVGKLGIVPKTDKNLWLNQRVGLLREKHDGARFIAYLHLKSEFGYDYIINTASGSAQENISASDIENCPFVQLSKDEIKAYSKTISPFFEKTIFNLGQIQTLEKLRDTLLPKLMSGEVRVKF